MALSLTHCERNRLSHTADIKVQTLRHGVDLSKHLFMLVWLNCLFYTVDVGPVIHW